MKRLLAIDGGGLKGLISLGILAELEAQLKAKANDPKTFTLGGYFDYIGGTSTGAIIAAGLMMGKSVAEIQNFYTEFGKEIFTPISVFEQIRRLGRFKYRHDLLRDQLEAEFTNKSIVQLQNEGRLPVDRHLMMVLHNVTTNSIWPLSTNQSAKYNNPSRPDCNLNVPLWQLVRASTAAPTYFAPEQINFTKDGSGQTFTFEDGGITQCNNPALKLFQMATLPAFRVQWPTGEDKMLLVSVGGGIDPDLNATSKPKGMPILSQVKRVPKALINNISVENDVVCRMLGHCTHGPVIDRELGDMKTDATLYPQGKKAFTYVRYDIDVSQSGLESHGINQNEPLEMDNAKAMDAFQLIGHAAAKQIDAESHFRLLI